jgi:hypothetical protein
VISKREAVEMLTREGDHETAARFAAMTDDEYAAMTTKQEAVEELTREGEPEMAARIDTLTDDEYANRVLRLMPVAMRFMEDPLNRLELELDIRAENAARDARPDEETWRSDDD